MRRRGVDFLAKRKCSECLSVSESDGTEVNEFSLLPLSDKTEIFTKLANINVMLIDKVVYS